RQMPPGCRCRARCALPRGGSGRRQRVSSPLRMRRGPFGRKCAAGYDLALMATAARPSVELERPGGRADVLIVRRITTGGRNPIHGPGARHWTMHYTLAGEREFNLRGRAITAEADTLLLYRREDASQAPRPSTRWDA